MLFYLSKSSSSIAKTLSGRTTWMSVDVVASVWDFLTSHINRCVLNIKVVHPWTMINTDGSNLTKTTTKLQSLLDGPLVKKVVHLKVRLLVKKVLKGTSHEEKWGVYVCLIPTVSILTRLCFRMEGMTDLFNVTFIENLSTLLTSCTEGKTLKTFFEIDKEFESMSGWLL